MGPLGMQNRAIELHRFSPGLLLARMTIFVRLQAEKRFRRRGSTAKINFRAPGLQRTTPHNVEEIR